METQDSIDIARLQRVALGLEHEPSQSSFFKPSELSKLPQTQSTNSNHHATPSHGEDSATADRFHPEIFSDAADLLDQLSDPSLMKQHETDPMNSTSSENNKTISVSEPSPATMDPATVIPSDTQVVSQSVYDSIIQKNGESMYDASENGADGATLMTLHKGDSGHIDLLDGFDTLQHDTNVSPEQDEGSNYDPTESSPLPYHPEFFPESQRFLTATPGTAVKINRTPRTLAETPSLSRNPLAGEIESSGGFMGLSQLFRATQAPSSPLVHGVQTEIPSDRPSPNIPIQQARVIHNPSSPLVHFARESSEPNLNYISMKESQSRRDRTLGERLTRSADDMQSDDPLDQEFNKESSFVENARRQRQLDEEAAAQFAALNAPDGLDTWAPSPDGTDVHNENAGAGSEEETEQEDEIAPQVPQSQELAHSSEEDKENFNGPTGPVIGHSSAHDRLSQALAIDSGSSSRNDTIPQSEARTTQLDSMEERVPESHEDQYPSRSSQVMVMDSQQSPLPSPRPDNHQSDPQPQPDEMELDPAPVNAENENKSPAQNHKRNSPSPSQQAEHRPDANASPHQHDFGAEIIKNTSSNEINRPPSSNSHKPQMTAPLGNSSQTGDGNKSSSMPSRITETPVHPRPTVDDMAGLTSIPETSPNNTENNDWEAQSNADGMNNEDDDLPPMFPVGSAHRISQVRGVQSRALSSPIKGLQAQAQAQVLSSPSGRQRRALTDIASDCSPQVDFKFGDISFDIFTAEDEQFNSLVIDGSPTRPRKRRRGNLGQSLGPSFNTSDTAVPATPRALPPKTTEPIRESPVQQLSTTPEQQPKTAVRKRGRPPRQDKNIWEIENSPQQQIIRRRGRYPKQPVPKAAAERPISVEKEQIQKSSQPAVIIYNSQQTKSSQRILSSQNTQLSELTDLDYDSEDRLPSESNATNSPPTTPRAFTAPFEKVEVAPTQVLAVWQGQKRAYYPGNCLGIPPSHPDTKLYVKFEDSAPVEVIKSAVKRLELRVGDGVKVEMRGVPKVTHIIRGFDNKLTKDDIARATASGYTPQTDIYGYSTLILGPKQRKSLPSGGLNKRENLIKVPISQIYLDTILWNQLKDRHFSYQPEPAPQTVASHTHTHAHTPSEKSSLPGSPSARLPRSTQSTGGVFADMAFAVSFKEGEASKNRITKLITDNGGKVLHDGFTELFEPASILPFDTPPRLHGKSTAGSHGLQLTPFAESMGFACLIADTYSRREKYMQALALGLPCLSGRWVEDCVAAGHVIDWEIYLLPAGDSTYLNGATKSRMMIPTPPSESRLAETIGARPKMLTGKSVLIVTGRGKSEEKRKAYIFLTFALGASRVERVPDLETVRAILEYQTQVSLPCKWDLIYVDDSDYASATSMLTPKTRRVSQVHGKKRKFDMSDSTDDSKPIAMVVGNEFFCQSLILGRLFAQR
ncbi:hypothetical protein N7478_005603 [Penicillium angulare]|uniref:uncharacterized protein n=1 Tax=Penicillium angulare TaxID=116970 RepID=UPI0025423A56|nr:uncharacterized protein N7478_005603 [Penicillium angulare]KAJ5280231.1 hypothetical protein N7478_005603 [Penicillium angulare]